MFRITVYVKSTLKAQLTLWRYVFGITDVRCFRGVSLVGVDAADKDKDKDKDKDEETEQEPGEDANENSPLLS